MRCKFNLTVILLNYNCDLIYCIFSKYTRHICLVNPNFVHDFRIVLSSVCILCFHLKHKFKKSQIPKYKNNWMFSILNAQYYTYSFKLNNTYSLYRYTSCYYLNAFCWILIRSQVYAKSKDWVWIYT